MTTDFNNIIPEGVLFNLKEIQEMHLMKVSMTGNFTNILPLISLLAFH